MKLEEALKLYEGKEGVKEIKSLIKKGINSRYLKKKVIDEENIKNMCSIHIAVIFGYKEIIEALINNGADINIKDGNGNTALATAIYYEWHKRANNFMQDFFDTKSDDINKNDNYINTEYKEIIYMLIEKGANVNIAHHYEYTPLMLASILGDTKMASMIINNGADIDAIYGYYGETSLIFSIIYGHIETASMLIERGADINLKVTLHKKNALMYAIEIGNKEMISMLIEKGIDINAQDYDGWTALMYASDKLNKDIVSILIKNGADINIKDNSGWTAKIILSNRIIARDNFK